MATGGSKRPRGHAGVLQCVHAGDFTGSESDDYHFGGQKAVKYRCLKPELFKDIAPGEVVRCFFDGKGRISYMVSAGEEDVL